MQEPCVNKTIVFLTRWLLPSNYSMLIHLTVRFLSLEGLLKRRSQSAFCACTQAEFSFSRHLTRAAFWSPVLYKFRCVSAGGLPIALRISKEAAVAFLKEYLNVYLKDWEKSWRTRQDSCRDWPDTCTEWYNVKETPLWRDSIHVPAHQAAYYL